MENRSKPRFLGVGPRVRRATVLVLSTASLLTCSYISCITSVARSADRSVLAFGARIDLVGCSGQKVSSAVDLNVLNEIESECRDLLLSSTCELSLIV